MFNIRIHLTDEGFLHLNEIIRVVFEYILLLKTEGPIERIFNEIQKVEKINFDFAEEKNSCDNVECISEAMQLYPPEHILTGSSLLYSYNPKVGIHLYYIYENWVVRIGILNLKYLVLENFFLHPLVEMSRNRYQ